LVAWRNAAIVARKFALDVPKVFMAVSFPVEVGLVQSLAHPGGKVTGIASEAALQAYGKRLQILKDIVPDLKRVAVRRNSLMLRPRPPLSKGRTTADERQGKTGDLPAEGKDEV
jgi:ABC-type uncharacterized transport system substrate-binding protein